MSTRAAYSRRVRAQRRQQTAHKFRRASRSSRAISTPCLACCLPQTCSWFCTHRGGWQTWYRCSSCPHAAFGCGSLRLLLATLSSAMPWSAPWLAARRLRGRCDTSGASVRTRMHTKALHSTSFCLIGRRRALLCASSLLRHSGWARVAAAAAAAAACALWHMQCNLVPCVVASFGRWGEGLRLPQHFHFAVCLLVVPLTLH